MEVLGGNPNPLCHLATPATPCPICMDVLTPCPTRHQPTFSRGCRQAYHLSCIARARAPASTPPRARSAGPHVSLPKTPPCPRPATILASTCTNALLAMPSPHAPPSPPRLWHHQGPPHQPVRATANSWLYVPLLHAATGTLLDGALQAWRRSPRRPVMGGGACPPGRIPSHASARPGSSLPPPPGT